MSAANVDQKIPSCDCDQVRRWPQEELVSLVELYEGGADFEILAKEFGIGIKGVWHRLSWLYLDECCPEADAAQKNHGKRWKPSDDAQLLKLHGEGVPVQQMAAELGRSPQAVAVRLLEKWWARLPLTTIHNLGLNPDDF